MEIYEHRLLREARRATNLLTVGLCVEIMSAFQWTFQLWNAPVHANDVVQVIGVWLAVPVTFTLRMRWRDRTRWYAATENWWEKMEEAPPIYPFPKVVAFFDRLENRGK